MGNGRREEAKDKKRKTTLVKGTTTQNGIKKPQK